jgi:hypothetical protein
VPFKYDGKKSRMVLNLGGRESTLGSAFTTIKAVTTSPGKPPGIFISNASSLSTDPIVGCESPSLSPLQIS